MPTPILLLRSDGTIDVPLHRQDTEGGCGAACIQMVLMAAQSAGRSVSPVPNSQRRIHDRAKRRGCSRPDECRFWSLCPECLAAELLIPADEEHPACGYEARGYSCLEAMLAELSEACRGLGAPVVVMADGGAHWIVVHGASPATSRGISLDIRDPSPPLPLSLVTTSHHKTHRGDDCLRLPGSVIHQRLDPDEVALRITPGVRGGLRSPWIGMFVAVVPRSLPRRMKAWDGELSPSLDAAPGHGGAGRLAGRVASPVAARSESLGDARRRGRTINPRMSERTRMETIPD